MTFTAPPARFLAKAILIAILIGSIASFVFLAVGSNSFNPTAAFGLGSFIGALLGSWLAGVGENRPEPAAAATATERKSVFVGNLAFKAQAEDLRKLFAQYGDVQSVRIMSDRITRRPRGFAFVEMDSSGAQRAIAALNGQEFMGRKLRVNEGSERPRGQEEA